MIKQRFYKSVLLSLLLFLHSNCFAVTEYVSKINIAASEDYNTLTLWEAAMDDAGNITDGTVKTGNWDAQTGSPIADATAVDWDGGASTGTLINMQDDGATGRYLIDVTGGSLADDDVILDVATSTDGFTINGTPDSAILTAECYKDDGDLEDQLTIQGLIANSTNFMKVTVVSASRHTGQPNTGFEMFTNAGGDDVNITDSNVIFEWVEIDSEGRDNNDCLVLNRGTLKIAHLIIHDSDDYGMIMNNSSISIYNCIVYDTVDAGIAQLSGDLNTIYNCTVYSSDEGIGNLAGAVVTIYNNVSMENGRGDFVGGDLVGSHNCSADGTADDFTATNGIVDKTDTDNFTNPTGDDFTVKDTGADIYNSGTDNPGTGLYSDDIVGFTRTSTWDIGAFEFDDSAAPTALPQVIIISKYDIEYYPEDWYAPQEAGKVRMGRRWEKASREDVYKMLLVLEAIS